MRSIVSGLLAVMLLILLSGISQADQNAAQEKANRMARTGILSHGGRLAGRYEGIGFSSRSAQDAIKNCCYWGRRTPIAIATARGSRGYYAVVGYK